VVTKYVLISSIWFFKCRNHTITMFYSFPALFSFILHHVAAMYILPFLKWQWLSSSPEKRERFHKKRGRDAALNYSKSVLKNNAYTFQRTRSYLFFCSMFNLDWVFFLLKMTIKTINMVPNIQTPWAIGFAIHIPTVHATAYKLTREMEISNNLIHETKTAGWLQKVCLNWCLKNEPENC
jgi:hypothetical protein